MAKYKEYQYLPLSNIYQMILMDFKKYFERYNLLLNKYILLLEKLVYWFFLFITNCLITLMKYFNYSNSVVRISDNIENTGVINRSLYNVM